MQKLRATTSRKSQALMPAAWMVFLKSCETFEKGVPMSSWVRSRASSAVVIGKGSGKTPGGISDAATPTGVELTLSTTSLNGSLETITACFNTMPNSAKERPARLC